MVFFVDHDRAGLVLIDENTGARLRLAEFSTYEVAFNENLSFKVRKISNIKKCAMLHLREIGDLIDTPSHNVTTLCHTGTLRKWRIY